jgi:hypothetical protein
MDLLVSLTTLIQSTNMQTTRIQQLAVEFQAILRDISVMMWLTKYFIILGTNIIHNKGYGHHG